MAAIRPRDLLSADLLAGLGRPGALAGDIAALAEAGYLNVALPAEFGGLGCTLRQAACGQRRLARHALAAVTRWYRARGLPPMIAVPTSLAADSASDSLGHALIDRLSELGWLTRPGPAFVMLADLSLGIPFAGLPDGRVVRMDDEPDDAWVARYHYRGKDYLPPAARKVLTSAADQWFVSIREGDQVLAIARLSIAEGWAGLTAVEVHPDYRRQGLGAAITAAACREAALRGIAHAFLQVEVGNAAAQALYERLGFRRSHRYHYRVAPD